MVIHYRCINTSKKLNIPGRLEEFEGDSNPLKLSQ
jgi:hypothetical protein